MIDEAIPKPPVNTKGYLNIRLTKKTREETKK